MKRIQSPTRVGPGCPEGAPASGQASTSPALTVDLEGPVLGFRIARWKRDTFRRFLAPVTHDVVFVDHRGAALRRAAADGRTLLGWAADVDDTFRDMAERAGVPVVLVEDGFLRSVGLGASFLPPASLVFDRTGIYYDARRPSELERLLSEAAFPDPLLQRAASLRVQAVSARLSKYTGVGGPVELSAAPGRSVVLVVGQVENDASIRCGLSEVKTNCGLLEAVRAARPESHVVFKPHPDVEYGLRRGHVPARSLGDLADEVATGATTAGLLDRVDEVHTISSLVGFEALMRRVPTVTYGSPFYAGWGLTEDHIELPRRGRTLSLDELVAAALILYPRYIDPIDRTPCSPEVVVDRLAAGISVAPDRRPQERARRAYRKVYGLARRALRGR